MTLTFRNNKFEITDLDLAGHLIAATFTALSFFESELKDLAACVAGDIDNLYLVIGLCPTSMSREANASVGFCYFRFDEVILKSEATNE